MPASPVPIPIHQRASGRAEVVFEQGRLQRLFQRGSAKAITLYPGPEVVFLNTSGGLTGGDRLSYALHSDRDVVATTQTAERAYRAAEGEAQLAVDLVQTAGHLDWLPQETILFDACALSRRTTITLGPDASCLALESVVLGRAAMGETVRTLALRDTRRIQRGGVPVSLEPLRIAADALAGAATLGGARAFASLVLVAPGAQDAVGRARAVLTEDGVQGGASGFDGRLTIRLLARDGWPLRRQITRLLAALRPGPPPRVWQI